LDINIKYTNLCHYFRIHAQGNAAKMKNHPEGRAIMFEGPVYSKRVIMNFTTTLAKFEEVLKFIELFDGTRILFLYITFSLNLYCILYLIANSYILQIFKAI
jgi:hypothetical protein